MNALSDLTNIYQSSFLPNGLYKTFHGSIVRISGQYGGIVEVDFDWLEEGGCVGCQVQPYPEEFGSNDWRLVWHCDICGGGNAKLHKVSSASST